jgi:hypothetical protein
LSCSEDDIETTLARKHQYFPGKERAGEDGRRSFGWTAASGSFTREAEVYQPLSSVRGSVMQHTIIVVDETSNRIAKLGPLR